uniref:Uncharacterized protein n=1 Tax=Salix viminalis TaxID=40686 RepID=A0A6N2MN11_SALVM
MEIVGATTEQLKRNDHVSLGIDKLTESLQEELKTLHAFSDKRSIYRVPKGLRGSREYAYTPPTVSIGPIHHGKEELKEMEGHKKLYLEEFLKLGKVSARGVENLHAFSTSVPSTEFLKTTRLEDVEKYIVAIAEGDKIAQCYADNVSEALHHCACVPSTEFLKDYAARGEFLKLGKVSVEKYIVAIAEKETRLRNCYADNFDKITSPDFVKMVLLDSSFIIMVFLKQCSFGFRSNNDRIFSKPWTIEEVKSDMCLLENQIPFFILDDLLKLAEIRIQVKPGYSMIELTRSFFSHTFGNSCLPMDILKPMNSSRVKHFVDFLRIYLQPKKGKQRKPLETRTTPSAMELHQSGVEFQSGSNKALFDINFDFENGILEIPPLFSWIAQRCDFITTIKDLVHSTNDVEILVKKGIIDSWLSDNDAVMRVLHDLDRGNMVYVEEFCFADVVEDLNKYCRKRRHRWIAALKQNYFHNPWVSTSVVAAGALLILTVIQAVCSVIQVT